MCYRVMDDIKDSVRASGAALANSLTSTAVRLCSGASSGDSSAVHQVGLSPIVCLCRGIGGPRVFDIHINSFVRFIFILIRCILLYILQAQEVLGAVLEVFLRPSAGLSSSVAEIRVATVRSLCKLLSAAGADACRPHLAAVVPRLLESLSGMEDPRLSYLEQQAAHLGAATAGRIDAARGEGEALRGCLSACES